MQFDIQRAFPYPVLRPYVDDYTDGEFQCGAEFKPSADGRRIDYDLRFALSVDEIKKLIARGDARYVVVISCRDTYLRRVVSTKDDRAGGSFDAGELRGEVQIMPYVVAQTDLRSYRCPLINPEFGVGPFAFERGSVLAVDEPKAVYIDRDLFKPITSIFELVQSENLTGPEWHVDFSGQRVRISVAPYMKEKLDSFRQTSRNKAILLNSIYFAAVMQALRHLAAGEFDDNRWAQVIRQQCINHSINLGKEEEYLAAERLMKLPLGMMDTYVFKGAEE